MPCSYAFCERVSISAGEASDEVAHPVLGFHETVLFRLQRKLGCLLQVGMCGKGKVGHSVERSAHLKSVKRHARDMQEHVTIMWVGSYKVMALVSRS